MNLTDNEFSKKIKRLFVLANNTKMCHWNLADVRIEDKIYSFRIMTEGFYGCVILIQTPVEDRLCYATLTYTEMNSFTPQQVSDTVNQRMVVIEVAELMPKLDALATKVVGHRAPQCENIPQGNR